MDELARELTDLLERARGGCPDAARLLYERYGRAVQRAVRRRLAAPLRRHFDSADFIQSVWGSFFTSPREYRFSSPQELVAFLSRIAYNKVAEKARQRLGSLRYDMSREVSLDEVSPDGRAADHLPAATPTPSQHAQADECWHGLTAGLPPGHRRALELLREGHSYEEIADRLGVNRKAMHRLLKRLSQRVD
jgi:RNA polymerase sigma factor (sigma-70 family)